MERISPLVFALLVAPRASEGIFSEDIWSGVSYAPSFEYALDKEYSAVSGYRALRGDKAVIYRKMLEFTTLKGCELALASNEERWATDLDAELPPSKSYCYKCRGGCAPMTVF